jgi:dethiobiotin synthetase
MKPICCGDRRDAELLLAAGSDGLNLAEINPVWLKTPAAPLTAAQIEGFHFELDVVMNAFFALQRRVENILVEGVGGWLVPIAVDFYVGDLAVAFGLPVLLVAENRLGCLNHTLLTLESIGERGLKCVGVVLNEPTGQSDIARATNREVLEQLCKVPVLTGLSEKEDNLSPEWKAALALAECQ